MVVGFEDGISEGFVGVAVIADDNIVFEHSEFISHKLQVEVDLVEVTLSANK